MCSNPLTKKTGILTLLLLLCQLLSAQYSWNMEFDGQDDFVQFPNHPAYDLNSFTLEAWVYLPGNPNTEVVVISNADNANNGIQWTIDQNGNQAMRIQGVQVIEPSVNLYDIGKCVHIGVTYNNSSNRVHFYMNGQPLSQNVLPNNTPTSSDLWLGASPATGNMFYRGLMDEVKIWDYPKTADQMQQEFNVNCYDDYDPLVLYVDFDEDPASQIVHDFSLYSNHGFRGSSLFADPRDPKYVDPVCDFEDCCDIEAYFQGAQTTTAGTPELYTNGSSGASNYLWSVNGTPVSTNVNLNTTFPSPGTYVVTLMAENGGPKCRDFYSLVVVVEPGQGDSCDASFNFSVDCNTVTLTSLTSVTGVQHFWDFGDGGSSSLVNPVHTYMNQGTYTITHIVNYGEDCSDTATVQINITCPDDPCDSTCNIVKWGDFEQHNITENNPLFDHNDQWLEGPIVPTTNSVDLYNGVTITTNSIDNPGITTTMVPNNTVPVLPPAAGGGEQYAGIGAQRYLAGMQIWTTRESLSFELCEPIKPGETYDISMLLYLYVGNSSSSVFRVQGSAEAPCPFWTQGDLAICTDEGCVTSCNNSNNYSPYDLAAFYPLNSTWTSHSSVYEHPASAPPLNYIVIFPEVPCPDLDFIYTLVDNVSICPSASQSGQVVIPNPNLNANFSYVVSTTDCPEVTFTANTASGTHMWDFGDGNTSAAVNPTHPYSAPGVYTVTHTITDGDCTSTEVMEVVVECKGCVDPWPRIYPGAGTMNTIPSVLGIDFDLNNDVYVLRSNHYPFTTPLVSASSELTKYCEDGGVVWSVNLDGCELNGYEPNSRLCTDDNGNSYVLVGYDGSAVVGATPITGTGTNLLVLKFNVAGTLVNYRSIPYTFSPSNTGYGEVESIKVSDNGARVYILMNDRIKQINPTTLLDVTDEIGVFRSIDIDDNGNFVYFVNSTDIGFFPGLGNTPVTTTVPPNGQTTDLEFDDVNDRLYFGTGLDVFVYDVTATTIAPNGISPMTNVLNSANYHEICPTPNGLLIYNTDAYWGVLPFEHIDLYNLAGVQQWNLPINGFMAPRSSIMLGFNNGYGYLGAMWWNNLNMGWYSTPTDSGSFVTRFDMTGNMAFKMGNTSEHATDRTPDFDRAGIHSGSLSVSKSPEGMVNLFPNPGSGKVEVEIVSDDLSEVKVSVINTLGQVVLESAPVNTNSGSMTCTLNLHDKPRGIYFVSVESNGVRIAMKKLILQ